MPLTHTVTLVAVGLIASMISSAADAQEKSMTYQVVSAPASIAFDATWDGEFWKPAKPLALKHYMGEKPQHFPQVQAKLAYDSEALYVIFQVHDRYVRAVAQKNQDSVYKDSCVEFFFTPHTDVAQGYFNLEMNCGGTMLLHYQLDPRGNSMRLSEADLAQIDVKHSLPKIVDPEITEPTQWTVAYRLPLDIFSKYFPGDLQRPAAGVSWRANLYKCADDTSHPHWLTWSPVDFERPDFHRPQSFGRLEFQ